MTLFKVSSSYEVIKEVRVTSMGWLVITTQRVEYVPFAKLAECIKDWKADEAPV